MSKHFSYQQRKAYINRLKTEEQDVFIIGGGATGAGILLDATTRGLTSALVDMQDFAQGTSGRSTKLIHGGLRYLKQFDFALVREVGRERAIVFENGPHVTKSEPMLLPLVKGGSIGSFGALFGMWLYDMLAGVKKSEQRKIINKISVLAMEPALRSDILTSGIYYFEYRTDDSRLTIEVIKEAIDHRALALNYCKVIGFIYEGKKVVGVKLHDLFSGEIIDVRAKSIVNASGPWLDEVDAFDQSARTSKLLLSKGVHIVVDASRLPIGQAMYVEAGAGRMIFVIPRDGKVYIGTTETEYVGDIANPPILMEDRNYLLQVINELFPDVLLTPTDVESGWSGLRPLIKKENKKPGEISRKDETFIHPSGLISIAGGKLTGYRKMAERVVNLIAKRLSASFGLTIKNCITASTPISGGHFGGSLSMEAYIKNQLQMASSLPWSDKNKELLARRYGSNFGQLLDIAKNIPVSTIDPALLTELEYSIQFEMVLTPMDFFIRRTSMYYFEVSKFMETKEIVLDYMKNRLNWSVEMTKLVEIEMNRDLTFLLDLKK